MLRTVIHEGAVSAAKAYSHAAVEPRHVLFALARRFNERPECAGFLDAAKRGLEPRGNSYTSPTISVAGAVSPARATSSAIVASVPTTVC
jgi:hypothetical protein